MPSLPAPPRPTTSPWWLCVGACESSGSGAVRRSLPSCPRTVRFAIVGASMARTHYDVMMLSPAADGRLLTVVYRHLAKRYHPDVDPSPEAAARMTELNEAYSVLSD